MYHIHCRCGMTGRVNQEGMERRQSVTVCPRCITRHLLIAGAVLGVDWIDRMLLTQHEAPPPFVARASDSSRLQI